MKKTIRSIHRRLKRKLSKESRIGFTHEHPVSIDKRTRLSKASFVGRYSYLSRMRVFGDVRIGRYCSIADDVNIVLGNHPMHYLSTHPFSYNNELFGEDAEYRDIEFKLQQQQATPQPAPQLTIGNDVWIGTKAIILGGVTSIGNGAVIGAGAIVTRDVPPYAIVAGNPARLIRYRFSETIIEQLEQLFWWDLPLREIRHLDFADIESCIRELSSIRNRTTHTSTQNKHD